MPKSLLLSAEPPKHTMWFEDLTSGRWQIIDMSVDWNMWIDNTVDEGRFLQWTVGVRKGEYFLDDKHITFVSSYYLGNQDLHDLWILTIDCHFKRTEAMNLLESAGFSRSTVHYVQRGKVMNLYNFRHVLKKYQQLDRQRRSLELTVDDSELDDARQRSEYVAIFPSK